MRPTFSIIIPAYNVAPYVRACLESVLAAVREFEVWSLKFEVENRPCRDVERVEGGVEVICIDDGSTDETASILSEYANQLQTSNLQPQTSNLQPQTSNPQPRTSNFKLIRQRNAGVGAARNAGLDAATGEWILFADADDAYLPETLVYLAKAVREADADVFHFGYCEVDVQNKPVAFDERPFRRYDLRSAQEARAAYAQTGMLMVWNVCARRSVIGDLRFETDMPIAEDCLFEQQLFFRAQSFAKTSTVLYKYYQRPGSAIHTPNLRGVDSAIRGMVKQHEAFESWPMRGSAVDVYRKRVRTTYCGQICERLRLLPSADRRTAWQLYVEAGRKITRRLRLEHLAFCLGWCPLVELVAYLPYRMKVLAHKVISR